MRLVLVTRQGCHLCEQAHEMLKSNGLQPVLADVDADDRLHDLYDWRVPVVLVDEHVVAEGRIDSSALAKQLRKVGLIA